MERVELLVTSAVQVETLRREARRLALDTGFPAADVECVVLATIELATNLARYGHNGYIVLEQVSGSHAVGIQIESHDDGPGIANIEQAMTDGFSTQGGLGNGLPAARRLLHEFEIESGAQGTDIVGRRWLKAS
jgi:serine/threonine-protein kinase RsbT